MSDVEAGEVLLERYIMVHLKNNEEKFVLLMEMISKLYKLANDEISPDNPDSLNNHVWFYTILLDIGMNYLYLGINWSDFYFNAHDNSSFIFTHSFS